MNKSKNLYDDGNIPEIDLPKNKKPDDTAEPFSELSRPPKNNIDDEDSSSL